MAESVVLVVDDDDSIRAMLVDILSYEGYRVVAARDGMEALRAIEEESPFLILLDMRMPMLDGRSFTRVVRENGISIPIVLMTASNVLGVAREINADGHIAKPFELPELLDSVARFRNVAGAPPATTTRA